MSSSKQDSENRVKGPWRPDEDTLLRNSVEENGPKNWLLISQSVPGRSAKSCRERWVNHLSSGVNHHYFTKEEDEKIIQFQAENPNKWSDMARMLPGRTDNAIKNRWHSNLKRKSLSSHDNDFGNVGGSESPSNRYFSVGSGALILPSVYYNPGSPSGSNANGNFVWGHDVRTVEKVGGMHGPSTNLSLSLPGIDFTESHSQFPALRVNSPPPDRGHSPQPDFNQGGFGSPFMTAPAEEPVQQVVQDVDEQATTNANFDGELLAVMQDMIKVEVEKYMEELKQLEEQRRFNQMVQRQCLMEHQHQRHEQHYLMYMQDLNEHSEVLENEAIGKRARVRRSE